MIGIIGGTGLYQLEALSNLKLKKTETPFGPPSSSIAMSSQLAFLPRHGLHHELLPGEINYRANIWALKSLGVTKLLSVSSVGSLSEKIRPGDFAIPDQYLDFTKDNRAATFFGRGLLGHVSMAEASCPGMTEHLRRAIAHNNHVQLHSPTTYACIEGPRYNTKAESFFLQNSGADLVGMTAIPEVFLAREAQMCHATLCVVTDYDCWKSHPKEQVSAQKVTEVFQKNIEQVFQILKTFLLSDFSASMCNCRSALENSLLSQDRSNSLFKVLSA